jgi:hypothetical protein
MDSWMADRSHRYVDRQTDRQTDRQAGRQAGRQTGRKAVLDRKWQTDFLQRLLILYHSLKTVCTFHCVPDRRALLHRKPASARNLEQRKTLLRNKLVRLARKKVSNFGFNLSL